ncbi:hypothetical protein [Winogradskyella thalassocola]|uniref:Uncharacterized protein n=1 Tax=Winogradskyella thalassocola TaxID=262004 RepID=A0A1G7XIA3_9FLAO|nr:hypothetical protein [Winogradskyella thalassocola]SDG83836.1 hypothetical protein SAMN04489796_101723 [Winogradskyella thalassocola]
MNKLHFLKLVLVSLFFINGNAQDNIDYKAIDSIGKAFTNRLKVGDIEYLESSKPQEGTWEYSRLLDYKKALNDKPNKIIIGSFIEPSINPDYWAFNLFALRRIDEKSFEYFFAAIVSIDVTSANYKIDATYLFTEDEPLKSWWKHIFGFYESKHREYIPKEFVFQVCPPPPFNEE